MKTISRTLGAHHNLCLFTVLLPLAATCLPARAALVALQEAILAGADVVANERFGYSVSLSADGATALVGAYQHTTIQGSAYVFVRTGGTWTQQAELSAPDAVRADYFGWSAALSSDGNTALVGAPGYEGTTHPGYAYVFVRSGSTWTRQRKLTASDGVREDGFGWSVSLSSDGNTALVGASYQFPWIVHGQGRAYVFVRSGSTWSEQRKLTASDGVPDDSFGYSVSLTSDGNMALVGAAPGPDATNAGSAYVFVRSGSTWSEQRKLTASDGAARDTFGYSVSLASDGNTALIGARYDDTAQGMDAGSAYVFVRSGTTWTEQAQLTADDAGEIAFFGASVSLCGDGNTALVGAVAGLPGPYRGNAYMFMRSGGGWTQQAVLAPSDSENYDMFGCSVSLNADATMALVGAQTKNTPAGNAAGSAYIFRLLAVPEGYNRLTAERLGGGAVRLTYIGLPGTNYALDQTFTLNSNIVWTPQVTNPAPPDGTLILTTTPDPATNHFWRMRRVP